MSCDDSWEMMHAGVPASRLLEEVQQVYDMVDTPMSGGLSTLLMAKADLDHDVGGQTLLHRLFKQPFPPDLGRSAQQQAAGAYEEDSEEEPEISLPELLAKHPTPNLRDAEGNTVLHVLILRTMKAEVCCGKIPHPHSPLSCHAGAPSPCLSVDSMEAEDCKPAHHSAHFPKFCCVWSVIPEAISPPVHGQTRGSSQCTGCRELHGAQCHSCIA